ncbi:Type 1 phosphatases regulator ypi1 [Coemansia spiralis]|uniref:Type 1 phosphatases regulator n=2 Tax=Coemansia TaxID=4863 RepID=A0A9W8G9Z4_9FUNG|nr:phosphatase inhibitor-domain-containing protein [Coemansia spiralis]KAJ1991596.1 Type 1 phosphatases regulator ypi1 [Coemansia umbellata]KAJ2623956.1 Type 1 phosphatases regulator ypi1 [Coemansia sp. RSA 1358]KAJ2679257.1 Type 1 phosphatases regulator ypi1 [Coemansia spiralis]
MPSSTAAVGSNSSTPNNSASSRAASPQLYASNGDSSASLQRGGYGLGRTIVRGGSANPSASHGSRTMVIAPSDEVVEPPAGILHLRGGESSGEDERRQRSGQPRVQWTDDTVDNEHLNKKKSKVCCIFRKERQFGESDSDESDSSCSSHASDSDSPNEYERMRKYKPKKHNAHAHCH